MKIVANRHSKSGYASSSEMLYLDGIFIMSLKQA